MGDRNFQRLLHIHEAISSIRKFCQDKTLLEFGEDDLLFSAVLQKLLIIGESVSKIDQDLLDKYAYPWYKPRAFRNFIAHEYFQILPERIWDTIHNDLDGLDSMVCKLIKDEYNIVV
jgi:uncharacterized protein with HEPN domain